MREAADASPAHAPTGEGGPPRRRGVSLRGLGAALNRPPIVALLWILALAHLAWVFSLLPGREKKIDFSVYYAAAVALHADVNPYTADLTPIAKQLGFDLDTQTHIAETPFFLLAFEPFARVSPRTAYWVWCGLNIAGLGIFMIVLVRQVGPGALALSALMLLYPPLTKHFWAAQSQLLVLALLALLMSALENENDALAGALLALAGALRAYPLALGAYLLLARRWRALAFAALFIGLITAVSAGFLGLARCESWLGGARYASVIGANPLAVTLTTFVSRFFWYGFGELSASMEFLRCAVIAAAEAAVLVLSVRATLASPNRFGFSVWVVAAILVSPIAWDHYLVLLFIPFGEVAAAAYQGACSRRTVTAMVASYALTTALYMLMGRMPTDRDFLLWVWVGQALTLSVLLAYLSAYWMAIDSPAIVRSLGLQDSSRLATQAS